MDNKYTELSFINDQEKMVDFFSVNRKDFLEFYSYISKEEYNSTIQDVLNRSGYWNADYCEVDDGVIIGKILHSIMLTEWLQNRKIN